MVRQVLREGGGDEGPELEVSDAEVASAMAGGGDDYDFEFSEEEMAEAWQQSRNEQVRVQNLQKSSQYLLKLKGRSPQEFQELADSWARLAQNQLPRMVQWMKALESGDVQTQLGYSNIDKYRDLSGQFLKNANWKGFAKWYLKLRQSREISTDPIKLKNREITLDPIKIKKGSGSKNPVAY
jgi:hypothetical protein